MTVYTYKYVSCCDDNDLIAYRRLWTTSLRTFDMCSKTPRCSGGGVVKMKIFLIVIDLSHHTRHLWANKR